MQREMDQKRDREMERRGRQGSREREKGETRIMGKRDAPATDGEKWGQGSRETEMHWQQMERRGRQRCAGDRWREGGDGDAPMTDGEKGGDEDG
ncbi:hypothetical protein ACLOJK_029976 [Asimina triloba]